MNSGYYSNEYWYAKALKEIWDSPNGKRTLFSGLVLIVGIGLIITAKGSPQSVELNIHWVAGQDLEFAHYYRFGGENEDGHEMSFYSIGFNSFELPNTRYGNHMFDVVYARTVIGNSVISISKKD